jgi:excisionase family DNA binding protein
MQLESAALPGPVPPRLRTTEAASYIGVSESYLNKLRVYGGGPQFLKMGKRVSYDKADLDIWMAARKRNSTSEYTSSAA